MDLLNGTRKYRLFDEFFNYQTYVKLIRKATEVTFYTFAHI